MDARVRLAALSSRWTRLTSPPMRGLNQRLAVTWLPRISLASASLVIA